MVNEEQVPIALAKFVFSILDKPLFEAHLIRAATIKICLFLSTDSVVRILIQTHHAILYVELVWSLCILPILHHHSCWWLRPRCSDELGIWSRVIYSIWPPRPWIWNLIIESALSSRCEFILDRWNRTGRPRRQSGVRIHYNEVIILLELVLLPDIINRGKIVLRHHVLRVLCGSCRIFQCLLLSSIWIIEILRPLQLLLLVDRS